MDIDHLRDGQIRLYQLDKADGGYTFYHDESNNFGKLRLNAQGLNVVELKVFVLGGVVHAGGPRPIEIQSLRDALGIHQKSAQEIKLRHVARGEFLELLHSAKLTTFLRWITDNQLLIQYSELDPLYWSIVDIVDSILPYLRKATLIEYHALMKSDLLSILREDLQATTALFHRYGYPDLAPESRIPFLNGLMELMERIGGVLPEFNHYMLKGLLQAGRKLQELVFIEDNTPNLLIENLSTSYLNRIALFKHSGHIFDGENVIRGHLMAASLTSCGEPLTNYRFADSKVEAGIQLADVVVGLVAKMHSYLAVTPNDEVKLARTNLAGAGLQNAELLRDLISRSHDLNVAFLHHVASVHDIQKLDMFLRFADGAYVD